MPSMNMGSPAPVGANVNILSGYAVIHSPFSGPKGSPFDAKTANGYDASRVAVKVANANDVSTGAMNTGLGFGTQVELRPNPVGTNPAVYMLARGFSDDCTPGVTTPSNTPGTTAIRHLIGGGRSDLVAGTGPGGNGAEAAALVSVTNPYSVQPITTFGGSLTQRDSGAGPAFTGTWMKMVTAAVDVPINGEIETGFYNFGPNALITNDSTFGVSNTSSAPIT